MLIGTFLPQTSFLRLFFELFVGRWTQIFIGRPEHPLHQHAPEIAPRSVCVSLCVCGLAALICLPCMRTAWWKLKHTHSPVSLNLLCVEGKDLEAKKIGFVNVHILITHEEFFILSPLPF